MLCGRLGRRAVPVHARSMHVDASFLRSKPFLSLLDFSPEEVSAMLDLSAGLKARLRGTGEVYQPLIGKSMAMMFQKRSTRTRVSSESGFTQLGGHALFLGSEDIQLGENESLVDTARVLSRFNDVLLARVFAHSDIETLAAESSVPVINALSDRNHPLQMLADLLTLREHFGELRGLTLSWIGDGNNILHSILAAAPKMGINLRIACPPGFFPDSSLLAVALRDAAAYGSSVHVCEDPMEAAKGSNVLVTDTFVSMGQEEEAAARLKAFDGFQITMDMGAVADPDWRFMHCLPRKPYEVDDEVFYSDRSLVWDEAENRKWTVMAVFLAQLQGGMHT